MDVPRGGPQGPGAPPPPPHTHAPPQPGAPTAVPAHAVGGPAAPRRRGPAPVIGLIIGASAFVALMSLLAGVALVSSTVDGARGGGRPATLRDLLDTKTFPDPPPLRFTVSANPLYTLKDPAPVDCKVPRLDPESKSSWTGFAGDVGGCLDRLWEPRLADAGLRSDKPQFKVLSEFPADWPDEGSGQGVTLAFYDSGDKTINVLMPSVSDLAKALPEADEGVWVALLAHEYGHHVQNRVGVLQESYKNEKRAKSENESMDSLRRTELQAECLGGAGVRGFGAFDAAEARSINTMLNGGGDLDSHGSAHNRQYWFQQGWKWGSLEECNTYTAPRARVR